MQIFYLSHNFLKPLAMEFEEKEGTTRTQLNIKSLFKHLLQIKIPINYIRTKANDFTGVVAYVIFEGFLFFSSKLRKIYLEI